MISKNQMIACLKRFCCCCSDTTEQNPQLPQRPNQGNMVKKQRKQPKQKDNRLVTKYQRQDFIQIGEEERRNQVKAYCCPICFLYFKRILACSQCFNFTCLTCFEQYEKKNKAAKQQMKCPFCASSSSKFIDYQLDPHSYFDASKQGFISKEERNQLDNQMMVANATDQEIGTTNQPEAPTSLSEANPSQPL